MGVSLEDETGIANLVLMPDVYERFRPLVRGAAFLVAQGRVERNGQVVTTPCSPRPLAAGHGPAEPAEGIEKFHCSAMGAAAASEPIQAGVPIEEAACMKDVARSTLHLIVRARRGSRAEPRYTLTVKLLFGVMRLYP
jgi:hypothetical protein